MNNYSVISPQIFRRKTYMININLLNMYIGGQNSFEVGFALLTRKFDLGKKRNYTGVIVASVISFHSRFKNRLGSNGKITRKLRSEKSLKESLVPRSPRRIYESFTQKTLIHPHSSLMRAIKPRHVCLIVTFLITGNVTKLNTFIFVIIRLSVFILGRKYRCPG